MTTTLDHWLYRPILSFCYIGNKFCTLRNDLLIYGCNGYTGKLISEHAVACGLKPTLAGRNNEKVSELARQLGLNYLIFGLDNKQTLIEHLRNFKVVLHCAGPFIYTSYVMAEACIAAGTHYLDITGEYQVFEKIFEMDSAAKAAKVLLMAGVGFDVVPTDCLAAYLKEELPDANRLELGLLQKGGRLSHGTALTITENMGEKTMIRKDGQLTPVSNGTLIRQVKPDGKIRTGVAISWGDISTAYRTTGIANIIVYNFLPDKLIKSMRLSNYLSFILKTRWVKNYLAKKIKQKPAGPNSVERQKASSLVWGEVSNALKQTRSAVLELPEGYTLTALTAVKIAENIIAQTPPYGSHTPAQVFGKDFILQFDGVSRRDL